MRPIEGTSELADWLRAHGMTIRELSETVGIEYRTLRRAASGKPLSPSYARAVCGHIPELNPWRLMGVDD